MTGPAQIRALLPHRPPMLLVDSVTGHDPAGRLTAVRTITADEPWYAGADPSHTDMSWPLPLLIESWVQSAALFATGTGSAWDGGVLLLGGLTGVVPGRPVGPGEVVEHHVRLVRSFDLTMIFEGESESGGDRVLTVGQAVLACRPASSVENHDSRSASPTTRNSDV